MAILEELFPKIAPYGKEQEPILDKSEIPVPPAVPEDLTILKIVNQDVQRAESYLLATSKVEDWNKCEKLYLFRVPIQVWEGTPIPRSHLGMPVTLEHTESLMPQIMTGIFADVQPFMSKPYPGTKMDAARANDAIINWELKQADFREQFRLLAKSTLVYGTGFGKWGWKSYKSKRSEWRRKTPLMEGEGSASFKIPENEDDLEQVEIEEVINQPFFEWVDIKHLLVDSSLRYPDVRKARWVAHRMYYSLREIEQWRDLPDFNVPPMDLMVNLFFPPKESGTTSGGIGPGASSGGGLAGNQLEEISSLRTSTVSTIDINQDFRPEQRYVSTTIDPYSQPLEVIEYVTNDNIYVVVQKRLLIRKSKNPYGIINFVSGTFVDHLGSFYGLGVCHLVGGEQRVQQGVINTFLDDLSITLNGMFTRVRGTNTNPNQVRMRPGGVIDQDIKDGIDLLKRQPIPMEALTVIASSDNRAQRRTGANEMLVQGTGPSEKTSLTRTATGVQTLTAGVGARLQYMVENLSDKVFVPVLNAFHMMNHQHLKPSQIRAILSTDLNQAYAGDPVDILNVRCQFEMLAGAKLSAKKAMAQNLPLLLQFLMTQPVLSALTEQGKKVEMKEIVNMLFDISGWPNRQNVIVDMSPQDQQRAMLNNPAVQQVVQQQSQMETQHNQDLDSIEAENVARAGRDVIKSLLKHVELRETGQIGQSQPNISGQ